MTPLLLQVHITTHYFRKLAHFHFAHNFNVLGCTQEHKLTAFAYICVHKPPVFAIHVYTSREDEPPDIHTRVRMPVSNTIILTQGMTELVKERPDQPVEWLATYLLKNNPNGHN